MFGATFARPTSSFTVPLRSFTVLLFNRVPNVALLIPLACESRPAFARVLEITRVAEPGT